MVAQVKSSKNIKQYAVGDYVIRGKDSKHPQIGWVVAGLDFGNVVVRWVSPGYPCSWVPVAVLDSITEPLYRRTICATKRRLEASTSRPVTLPESLLQDIHQAYLADGKITGTTPALIKIADYMGMPTYLTPLGQSVIEDGREYILDILAVWYPNWRQGAFL